MLYQLLECSGQRAVSVHLDKLGFDSEAFRQAPQALQILRDTASVKNLHLCKKIIGASRFKEIAVSKNLASHSSAPAPACHCWTLFELSSPAKRTPGCGTFAIGPTGALGRCPNPNANAAIGMIHPV